MKFSGPYQPKLVHEQHVLYIPGTGTSLAGYGNVNAWVGAAAPAVVSHPAQSASFNGQFRRTRITSGAVTANQELGIHLPNADHASIWRGNATGRGGFYFSSRFIINAMPFTDIRLFVGLSDQTVGECIADLLTGSCIGLFCDSGDAASLQIGTRDGSTQHKQALTVPTTLATGILYEFVMIAIPGQGPIVTQLLNRSAGTVLSAQNANTNPPAITTFMAPQIGLSNGAHVVGGDISLDILSLYARPNLHLDPAKAT